MLHFEVMGSRLSLLEGRTPGSQLGLEGWARQGPKVWGSTGLVHTGTWTRTHTHTLPRQHPKLLSPDFLKITSPGCGDCTCAWNCLPWGPFGCAARSFRQGTRTGLGLSPTPLHPQFCDLGWAAPHPEPVVPCLGHLHPAQGLAHSRHSAQACQWLWTGLEGSGDGGGGGRVLPACGSLLLPH